MIEATECTAQGSEHRILVSAPTSLTSQHSSAWAGMSGLKTVLHDD